MLTAETKPENEEIEERVEEIVETEPELKKAKVVDDNENEEIPEIGHEKGIFRCDHFNIFSYCSKFYRLNHFFRFRNLFH